LPIIKIKSTTNRENKKIIFYNNNNLNNNLNSNTNTNENKKIEKIKKIRILKFNHNIKQKKTNFFSSFDAISLPGSKNQMTKINQDSFMVLTNICNIKNFKIFGVFDGHGEFGEEISREVSNFFINYYNDINLYKNNILNTNNNNIELSDKNIFSSNNYSLIKDSYKQIDSKLKTELKIDISQSGTTSNIIIIHNNKIICSNLGDSRSIIVDKYNNIHQISIDDTPDLPLEKERITNLGGEISRVEWCDYGPFRVWFKNKNYPGLAMSRSLGDFDAEKIGVISEPQFKEVDSENLCVKFIVVATDGVWEFLSNEKVKNIILPYYESDDVKGANRKLCEVAKKFWEVNNKMGIDDITSIIIFYK